MGIKISTFIDEVISHLTMEGKKMILETACSRASLASLWVDFFMILAFSIY